MLAAGHARSLCDVDRAVGEPHGVLELLDAVGVVVRVRGHVASGVAVTHLIQHGEAPKKDAGAGGHGEKKDEGKKETKGHGAAGKKKQNYPVAKVIVNVSGSMGSRYLMTSFTLVGTQNDFKEVLDENKDQLLDLASTTLASKTISDLEKPGSRNQIRAELISIFNNALGGSYVQEIFFTEFAIQ